MTILAELQAAASRKWKGDPSCQQAGLFARAVAELERLHACVKKANDQAESFERAWSLRGDRIAQLLAERDQQRSNNFENLRQRLADHKMELERLTAERDAFKQALHDEMDENLRLRELGGAGPDETITAFAEQLIRERDELRAELDNHRQTLRRKGQ